MDAVFYYLPIIVTGIGILIHSLAVFGLYISNDHLGLHLLMLIIDSAVVIGLMKRSIFGYWLALGLYFEQGAFQTYWAAEAFYNQWDYWRFQAITAVLALICLAILGTRKPLFLSI